MRRTRLRHPLLPALLLCAAAGCSGSVTTVDMLVIPDGGFIVNGHPFSAIGQATVSLLTNDMPPRPAGWMVYLSDEANGCHAVMFPTGAYLRFQLPQNPVGVFNVNSGNTVFAVGRDMNAAVPKSGKITVNSHTAQQTSGTYDVIFETGEHLAGVFAAPLCE